MATLADRLVELASDTSPRVRHAVAENPSTPAAALAVLAGDSGFRTRIAVAEHPATTAKTLALLVRDPDRRVRWTAPSHPNLGLELHATLARSDEVGMRTILAGRPDLTAEAVEILRRDPDKDVVNTLASCTADRALIAELLHDSRTEIRTGVAVNEHLTDHDLRALAKDKATEVRATLAAWHGPALPLDVLEDLARDRSVVVRWNLTGHRMPPSVAAILSQDPDR